MQLEVEQKFPIIDPAATTARLSTAGIAFGAAERQVDTYFLHPDPARDFRQTDEAFRLRQVGELNYFTYKGPKLDASTKTRHELEVALVAGSESAAQYQQLLAVLGFQVGGVVSKSRRTGHYLHDDQPIELMWDDVDGLGSFLELEIVTTAAQFETARQAIQGLARRLQLGGAERRSYLALLLAKEAQK